jgi:hypothetical protein
VVVLRDCKNYPTVTKDSKKIQSTTKVLMNHIPGMGRQFESYTDRLRSGPGLPMSDILVDIGPVELQAPSTSPQPSLAHPCQWIRSDTRRYTHQGAALRVLNFVSPTALAPPTMKSENVPTPVLRQVKNNHRLQKPPSPGAARHTAPQRASGRSRPPPTSSKPRPHVAWSCAANTRNLLDNRK